MKDGRVNALSAVLVNKYVVAIVATCNGKEVRLGQYGLTDPNIAELAPPALARFIDNPLEEVVLHLRRVFHPEEVFYTNVDELVIDIVRCLWARGGKDITLRQIESWLIDHNCIHCGVVVGCFTRSSIVGLAADIFPPRDFTR